MDAVMNVCRDMGWNRLEDSDKGDYLKPVFQFGAWKCLIGRLWTTVWELKRAGESAEIGQMVSVRTANLDSVRALLQAAVT